MFRLSRVATACLLLPCVAVWACPAGPRPARARPPRGALVLFGGTDVSAWRSAGGDRPCAWRVADGVLEVAPGAGDIITRRLFRDCALHVEFALPPRDASNRPGGGNSGVKLHRIYEVQIIDSAGVAKAGVHDCGAVYRQKAPDQNVCSAPGEWQSYDITFRAPRLDAAGHVTEKPRITLVWNGVKVHDDVEIQGPTSAGSTAPMVKEGAILLQDHGSPVRFRNIWIKPLR